MATIFRTIALINFSCSVALGKILIGGSKMNLIIDTKLSFINLNRIIPIF